MIALDSFAVSSATSENFCKNELLAEADSYNYYTTIREKQLVHNLSKKSSDAIAKINQFLNLEENWDSYGSDRPSEISVENAKEYILKADVDGLNVYFTAPGRNGDIMVEYRLTKRISAELYFNSDGSNEVLIFGDDECISEGKIEDKYGELLQYNEF